MTRILIRGAQLVDGTGAPPRRADILLEGATVVAVEAGGLISADGVVEMDATGLTLTPGFIDVHSHADNAPFLADDDTSKIRQGVTTEVVGNCGFTLAPRLSETADALVAMSNRIFPEIPWSWSTFGEYLAASDAAGYVTNNAPLVGHNALRIAVIGMADRPADADALRRMGELLDEAFDAGAFGLSSGLAYPPGVFSSITELSELAHHLPESRPYVSHVRGESTQLRESVTEALEIGRRTGRRVQVSHLKCAGRPQWGGMPAMLAELDAAREAGLDVRHDVYPYTASSTMLTATLPPWFQNGGRAAVLERLGDPRALDQLRADVSRDDGTWENPVYGAGWDGVVIASSRSGQFDGRSLTAIGTDRDIEPFTALVHVLLTEELEASMIVHSMCEDDVEAALRSPYTMIGSDGLPPGTGGKPHPRMYGTFPRVFARYVRERAILDLPEAVRRMTSLSAETFGLRDRGVIAAGMAADLVALDPDRLRDTASFDEPVQAPAGIAWVMLNGEIKVRDGVYLGGRNGQRLTPTT